MRDSLTALSLLAFTAGCIPSHRIVHEGNRYFEYCYAADFDPRVAPAENEGCWQAWLAHYNRFQPAQRIDYAMRRVEALQAGEPPLRLPGIQGSSPANQVAASPEALQSAQAGTQPKADISAQAKAAQAPIPNGCLDACNAYEGRCVQECAPNGVQCRHDCTRERAICLGGCY
jgi:hypothetical protein